MEIENGNYLFEKASWLWEDEHRANRWMLFRKTFTLTELVASAAVYIAAETKYWLYINENLVVFEGDSTEDLHPVMGILMKWISVRFCKKVKM